LCIRFFKDRREDLSPLFDFGSLKKNLKTNVQLKFNTESLGHEVIGWAYLILISNFDPLMERRVVFAFPPG